MNRQLDVHVRSHSVSPRGCPVQGLVFERPPSRGSLREALADLP